MFRCVWRCRIFQMDEFCQWKFSYLTFPEQGAARSQYTGRGNAASVFWVILIVIFLRSEERVVQFFTELRISAPCSLESCWTWLNTLSSPLHRELVIRTLNQDYFFIILILFILLYLYLFTSLNLLCFIHEWNLFVCCLDKKCLLLFQATCEWNVNLYILYIMSLK